MIHNCTVDSIDSDFFVELINQYDPHQILLIVDENTMQFVERIHQITDYRIDAIQLPAGEEFKTINTVAGIWSDMTQNNFRRNGLVINLGGGVITDMGGFAAATFKRGVDFVNIPTTLLGMVDASIGGKTGVDYQDFKNQVGVIKDAVHVFCDIEFLKTLPETELLSGFAEVIKHGLVRDKAYWLECTTGEYKSLDWQKVVLGSVRIKSEIVAKDPLEKGERKLLNFGHTIGHAIESFYLESGSPILHGNGVAVGMICESHISFQQGLLSEVELQEVAGFISAAYPKLDIVEENFDAFLMRMLNDKKNVSDEINFTLLAEIGIGKVNCTASKDQIVNALVFYQSL
jgi:3-dehydroquinate synthase